MKIPVTWWVEGCPPAGAPWGDPRRHQLPPGLHTLHTLHTFSSSSSSPGSRGWHTSSPWPGSPSSPSPPQPSLLRSDTLTFQAFFKESIKINTKRDFIENKNYCVRIKIILIFWGKMHSRTNPSDCLKDYICFCCSSFSFWSFFKQDYIQPHKY